jgi:hypothetical protein
MVSAIDSSTRLISTKLALKAIQEQETVTENKNKRNALLESYGLDNSSSTKATLADLLTSLDQTETTDSASETTVPAVSTDVTTADFMKGLKAELTTLAADSATSSQAKAMLKALEAGTLTVTDPIEGVSIKAWDVDAKAEKETATKPGTKTETAGWSDFLKENLKRVDGASYAKGPDGAYIDTKTGNNAFFGTVGDKYYFLTWPQPKPATAAESTTTTVAAPTKA